MENLRRRQYLGIILASVHLCAFVVTVTYTVKSPIEQSSLVWLVWFPIDIPWSFINILGGEAYSLWLANIASKSFLFEYAFYTPYLVHGLIGTIWWYYLPTFISKISFHIKGSGK